MVLSYSLSEGIFSFVCRFGLIFLLIYIFQVNLSSRYIPKYLIDWSLLFHIMDWLRIFNWVVFKYFLKVNIFVSLLFGFKISFYFVNRSDIWSSAICRSIIEFSKFLCCVMIAESSVYIAIWYFCGFGISWQKTLNRVSPRTDPYGNPTFIVCFKEVSVPIRIWNVRYGINDDNIL